MPSKRNTGSYRTRPHRDRGFKLVDHHFAPEPEAPERRPQFTGLTPTEERLWPHLERILQRAKGWRADRSGELIGTLHRMLESHGLHSDRGVLELVNHAVSDGRLVKRSRCGQLLGIALPDFEKQLDKQLDKQRA